MKIADRLQAVDSSAPVWETVMPDIPGQDATLMRLLRVASQGITACVDPLLRPDGLTESSCHALIVIMASGSEGIAPAVLCDQVGQTRANMTRILAMLQADKRVNVASDGRDGRRKKVSITPAGRRLVQKYSARLAPAVIGAMGGFSASDKATLDRLLRAWIQAMDKVERGFPGRE